MNPKRGGFMRPVACGLFIRDFLLGRGPYGSSTIEPDVGAPQADIFMQYKEALRRAYAEDRVAKEEEKRVKKGLPLYTIEEADTRVEFHLKRFSYRHTGMTFHSFVVYFSGLQRLGWVEFTGREEPSAFQDYYPPGPPRRFFHLTAAGRAASDAAWGNPVFALYGERGGV